MKRWLPVEPLLTYVASRGGIDTFFQEPVEHAHPDNFAGVYGERRTTMLMVIPAHRQREAERVQRGLWRARSLGRVEFYWADEVCCRVMSVHPSLVFGSAWWVQAAREGPVQRAARTIRFTDDEVRSIRKRRADGELNRDLAIEYGVAESVISNIHNRRHYAHVSD